MTLVLTELSSHGITMAADSAVTLTQPQTGFTYAIPNAAKKLQVIPYLNAGISCWGLGTISGNSTDQWLSNFINLNNSITTLYDFANELARQLNANIASNTSGNSRLGFHLAGYEDFNGTPTPSFYHIHDGPSSVLQQRGVSINPNQFNANHDLPPQLFQHSINSGAYVTRNGDYQLYANIFSLLNSFFQQLQPFGIIVPYSQNLADRAEYLVFQIRMMSEIYRLSNLVPGIGGGIHYLTINPVGIHSHGTKYF
ncbi:MAG: hypothetical protein NTX52_04230 [Planctomycetota bacterium]|nr:hypothetical protein [Planctomycetota bacterium]